MSLDDPSELGLMESQLFQNFPDSLVETPKDENFSDPYISGSSLPEAEDDSFQSTPYGPQLSQPGEDQKNVKMDFRESLVLCDDDSLDLTQSGENSSCVLSVSMKLESSRSGLVQDKKTTAVAREENAEGNSACSIPNIGAKRKADELPEDTCRTQRKLLRRGSNVDTEEDSQGNEHDEELSQFSLSPIMVVAPVSENDTVLDNSVDEQWLRESPSLLESPKLTPASNRLTQKAGMVHPSVNRSHSTPVTKSSALLFGKEKLITETPDSGYSSQETLNISCQATANPPVTRSSSLPITSTSTFNERIVPETPDSGYSSQLPSITALSSAIGSDVDTPPADVYISQNRYRRISGNHIRETLQKNYIFMKENLLPKSEILDHLHSVLNEDDLAPIKSASTRSRQADLTIKLVDKYRHNQMVFATFMAGLEKYGFTFIKAKLDESLKEKGISGITLNAGSSCGVTCSRVDFDRKKRQASKYLEELEARDIIDDLLQKRAIPFTEHENVFSGETLSKRLDVLLKVLDKDLDRRYYPFVEALRNADEMFGYGRIADKLEAEATDSDVSQSDDNSGLTSQTTDAMAVDPINIINQSIQILGAGFNLSSQPEVRITFVNQNMIHLEVINRIRNALDPNLESTMVNHFDAVLQGEPHIGSVVLTFNALTDRTNARWLKAIEEKDHGALKALMKAILTKDQVRRFQQEGPQAVEIEVFLPASNGNEKVTCCQKKVALSRELIVQNFSQLSDKMPDVTTFLAEFLNDKLVSKAQAEELKSSLSETCTHNETFLRFLLKDENECCIPVFQRALEKTPAVSLLKGICKKEKETNSEVHLRKTDIEQNLAFLMEEIDGFDFIKVFESRHILDTEKLIGMRDRKGRTELFLRGLLQGGEEEILIFEKEIERQGLDHVLSVLRESARDTECCDFCKSRQVKNIIDNYWLLVDEVDPIKFRDLFENKSPGIEQFRNIPRKRRSMTFINSILKGSGPSIKELIMSLRRKGMNGLVKKLTSSSTEETQYQEPHGNAYFNPDEGIKIKVNLTLQFVTGESQQQPPADVQAVHQMSQKFKMHKSCLVGDLEQASKEKKNEFVEEWVKKYICGEPLCKAHGEQTHGEQSGSCVKTTNPSRFSGCESDEFKQHGMLCESNQDEVKNTLNSPLNACSRSLCNGSVISSSNTPEHKFEQRRNRQPSLELLCESDACLTEYLSSFTKEGPVLSPGLSVSSPTVSLRKYLPDARHDGVLMLTHN